MTLPVLYGFSVSPHVRAARIAFQEKAVEIELNEVALEQLQEEWFGAVHPFRKIPALVHGDLTLFETPALLVYADAIGTGAALVPASPANVARLWQFVGIAQNYLYPAGVMQLYFHTVLTGLFGMKGEPAVAAQAVDPVALALDVLEHALSGEWLAGAKLSLADIYCGVMVDYVARTNDGRMLIAQRLRVAAWLERLRARPSFVDTLAPMLVGTDQR